MFFADLEMPLLPPSASDYAHKYDLLFWYITAVITVTGLGVYGALAWFSWKYMKRPGARRGTSPGQAQGPEKCTGI